MALGFVDQAADLSKSHEAPTDKGTRGSSGRSAGPRG